MVASRESVTRTLVAAFLLVGGAAALWRASAEILHLGKLAGESSRLDFADREIAGGNGIVIDQAAAYQARALIPQDASYRMLSGPHLNGATPLSEPFAGVYFRYFLMPRRQSEHARWIVCFGCDLAAQAPGATPVWSDDEGIAIARAAS